MSVSEDLHLAELAVLGVAVLGVTFLGAVYVRRRVISRGSGLVLCAERAGWGAPWRYRLARYDLASLDLFSVSGFEVAPLRRLPRGLAGLLDVTTLPREQWPTLMTEPVVLQLVADGAPLELAVSPVHYTALRSWIESSPPGLAHPAA